MCGWVVAAAFSWLQAETPAATALWDVPRLLTAPSHVTLGTEEGVTQEIWYEGEPFQGKPTRIFAYLGRPAKIEAPLPAVLLVHGGGGRAFKDWVQHWVARGYVALAMDTAGQGPDGKRHANAGPDQSDTGKFRNFSDAEARDMWTYHAVAAIVRGHGYLASRQDVDKSRIGIVGMSWGGYLTCLTAGLDHDLKVAVPVYGCGFLNDNSVWRDNSLAAMDRESRERWVRLFDPSATVGQTTCPIFFFNGTHDFAYPPDSHRKTYSLVKPDLRTVGVRVDLAHGHIFTFEEVDAFVAAALKPGPENPPLTRIVDAAEEGGTARATVAPGTPAVSATLHVTTDTGQWQKRQWKDLPATVENGVLKAQLPPGRPLTWFFTAKDARGLITGSSYAEIGTSENSACLPKSKLEDDFYDWNARHEAVLAARAAVKPDIVMLGDSITHLWGGEPREPRGDRGADAWRALFTGKEVLNLGFGWDRTQNVLWRIDHGELDGIAPRLIVVNIGTNNLAGTKNARANTPAEIAEGIQAVVRRAKARCPSAKIVLMGVFPRGQKPDDPFRAKVAAINALLPEVAKATGATFLDITTRLLQPDGTISREVMGDYLHPAAKGYSIWGETLREHLPR